MTFIEMLEHAERVAAQGLTFMVLTVARNPRGERVRILSGSGSKGLYGRVIGSTSLGCQVSVEIAEVRRWLMQNLSAIQGAALEAAEQGDDERADRLLADFVAVRDRLDNLQPRSA